LAHELSMEELVCGFSVLENPSKAWMFIRIEDSYKGSWLRHQRASTWFCDHNHNFFVFFGLHPIVYTFFPLFVHLSSTKTILIDCRTINLSPFTSYPDHSWEIHLFCCYFIWYHLMIVPS
jgi:hypothetical protein